ncbi:hypothetical protein [Sulfurivirga sp.]|uniref:hypothetical protein n=1 Tax=Sulfurivirga sp. TaxID=2614236 RepID=UPI0025F4BF78|nr:hypothetical protein [Sulfurivirga sp.]
MNQKNTAQQPADATATLPPQYPYGAPFCDEDEIDLGEVFRKIGRGKAFIGWVVLLTSLAVAALGVLWFIKNPSATEYGNIIRFNFPTAEQGRYPSGQRFTRNDIVASAVLAKVYRRNHLDRLGISMEDFGAAITVSPYAPNAEFIRRKYEKLLSNRKLSQAEIAQLEQKYQAELSAAQSRFAKVAYTSLSGLGLSDQQIEKVLKDIPQVWSETAIRELGVLDLNIPSAQFFQPGLVDAYEYIQAVQYLKDSADTLKASLKALKEDEIGAQVRDPETGMMVSDIQSRLDSLNSFLINPLMPLVASAGIARNLVDATTYAENKIQQLKDQIETLKAQAAIYQQAIDQYAQVAGGAMPANGATRSGNGIVQYGSDFLSKITELVEKQKDAQFRQQLIQKEIDLRLKITELENQVRELSRALHKYRALSDGKADAASLALKNSIEKKIAAARDELKRLIDIYQRVRDLRSQQIIGRTGALYEQAAPDIQVTTDLAARLKKLALVMAGLDVLALFVAIMIVLVRKPEKSKGEKEDSAA